MTLVQRENKSLKILCLFFSLNYSNYCLAKRKEKYKGSQEMRQKINHKMQINHTYPHSRKLPSLLQFISQSNFIMVLWKGHYCISVILKTILVYRNPTWAWNISSRLSLLRFWHGSILPFSKHYNHFKSDKQWDIKPWFIKIKSRK